MKVDRCSQSLVLKFGMNALTVTNLDLKGG